MSEPNFVINEHGCLPDKYEPWNEKLAYGNGLLDLKYTPFGAKGSNDNNKPCWHATYRIGAQWLDENKPLVVTPKIENIDFIKMFLDILDSELQGAEFSKLYSIDFEQPAIKTAALDNVLTPLILVHFLTTVEKIAKRGLKKGYVTREENLKKVKGRIRILANERKNIIPRRFDRVYCQYNEFTVDIPENRLIKKALLFAKRELLRFEIQKHGNSCTKLIHLENKCLSAFEQVSPEIALREVKLVKNHKLYRDYDLAINLAKTILRRNDYSIQNASSNESKKNVPAFYLDMAYLFELYVYSILRKEPGDKIKFQAVGEDSQRPDFLFINGDVRQILDAKYIDLDDANAKYRDIVRQLAGYARDRKILKDLGYKTEEEQNNVVVPCVFIYPNFGTSTCAKGKILDKENLKPIDGWTEFYKIRIEIPRE